MAYFLSDQLVGYQPVATVDTVQRHPLGTIARGYDVTYGGAEFIYLKGVASTVLGSWVTYNIYDGTTTLAVANAIGPVAIAMAVLDASTKFGWYQIEGLATSVCTTVSTVADNAVLYLTATGGQVDDAVVSGDFIYRAKAAALTTTNGTLLAEIHRPYVTDQTT
jgi:hypothetical protein